MAGRRESGTTGFLRSTTSLLAALVRMIRWAAWNPGRNRAGAELEEVEVLAEPVNEAPGAGQLGVALA
jgi:hypothetical protein